MTKKKAFIVGAAASLSFGGLRMLIVPRDHSSAFGSVWLALVFIGLVGGVGGLIIRWQHDRRTKGSSWSPAFAFIGAFAGFLIFVSIAANGGEAAGLSNESPGFWLAAFFIAVGLGAALGAWIGVYLRVLGKLPE